MHRKIITSRVLIKDIVANKAPVLVRKEADIRCISNTTYIKATYEVVKLPMKKGVNTFNRRCTLNKSTVFKPSDLLYKMFVSALHENEYDGIKPIIGTTFNVNTCIELKDHDVFDWEKAIKLVQAKADMKALKYIVSTSRKVQARILSMSYVIREMQSLSEIELASIADKEVGLFNNVELE